MTSPNENRFMFPAWRISLSVHGAKLGLVLLFAAQVTPMLQENLFQWDVALVRIMAEKQLEAELERLKLCLSTTRFVLNFQRDLATAQGHGRFMSAVRKSGGL
jgi:hypothetical protein